MGKETPIYIQNFTTMRKGYWRRCLGKIRRTDSFWKKILALQFNVSRDLTLKKPFNIWWNEGILGTKSSSGTLVSSKKVQELDGWSPLSFTGYWCYRKQKPKRVKKPNFHTLLKPASLQWSREKTNAFTFEGNTPFYDGEDSLCGIEVPYCSWSSNHSYDFDLVI